MIYEHLDLFSGIGGFALAAHQNGIDTVQFVEIDERCRTFLSKTWPGVKIHDDIRTFHWDVANSEEIGSGCGSIIPAEGRQVGRTDKGHSPASRPVFLLTGGVPCQPASRAGKQRGAEDDRWLWPEAVRVLGEVKPTWAVFENPPGIGDVGLSGILSDVEDQGYEVRVFGVPACAIGAPHIRERYYIVGKSNQDGRKKGGIASTATRYRDTVESDVSILLADSPRRQDDLRRDGDTAEAEGRRRGCDASIGCAGEHMAYAETTARLTMQDREKFESPAQDGRCYSEQWGNYVWLPCADGKVRRAPDDSFGLVDGLHRSLLGALGNSIVPQVATKIIGAIMEVEIAI